MESKNIKHVKVSTMKCGDKEIILRQEFKTSKPYDEVEWFDTKYLLKNSEEIENWLYKEERGQH